MSIKKSPWICYFDCGSCNGCNLEILASITPKYDIERFGCLWRISARHADILMVTGIVNRQSKKRLINVYNQMAKEKYVIAVGSCAISGGPFAESYNAVGPVDKIIPVDLYIPGCPPRPEAIIFGLLKLLRRINAKQKS